MSTLKWQNKTDLTGLVEDNLLLKVSIVRWPSTTEGWLQSNQKNKLLLLFFSSSFFKCSLFCIQAFVMNFKALMKIGNFDHVFEEVSIYFVTKLTTNILDIIKILNDFIFGKSFCFCNACLIQQFTLLCYRKPRSQFLILRYLTREAAKRKGKFQISARRKDFRKKLW